MGATTWWRLKTRAEKHPVLPLLPLKVGKEPAPQTCSAALLSFISPFYFACLLLRTITRDLHKARLASFFAFCVMASSRFQRFSGLIGVPLPSWILLLVLSGRSRKVRDVSFLCHASCWRSVLTQNAVKDARRVLCKSRVTLLFHNFGWMSVHAMLCWRH